MFKIIFANLHLEKILWSVKTKILYIILLALVGGVLGGIFAVMFGQDVYRANITMMAYSNPDYATDSGININVTEVQAAQQLITSYSSVIKSSIFLESVIETAGLQDEYTADVLQPRVNAIQVQGTSMFTVFVTDVDPKNAQLIANTIGKIAPEKLIELVKAGGVQMLNEAALPIQPYKSASAVLYAFMGAVAFGGCAVVVFIIVGLFDSRIRRKYEIEDMFNIPIISTVPKIEANKGSKKSPLLTDDSSFELKEAYNEMRTNILYLNNHNCDKIFAFTSADKGEGKTVSALNTAKSLSLIGKKVLYIDADLRFSHTADVLGMTGNGLSEYLSGESETLNIQHSDKGFDVILAGKIPVNAADLMAGDKIKRLLEEQRDAYDIVIVDLAPIGRVTDGFVLSNYVSAYILVVREFITRFEREEKIVRELERLGCVVGGIVYNAISPNSNDYNYKKAANRYGYVDNKVKVVSAKKVKAAK